MRFFALQLIASLVVVLVMISPSAAVNPFGLCPPGSPPIDLTCASFDVPVDYSNNKSGSMRIIVTKYEDVTTTTPLGNLWYLNFGCDAWSASQNQWVDMTSRKLNFRILTPSMRGDGLSVPRLYCDADQQGFQDPPSAACAAQVTSTYTAAQLANYNLANAANDINLIVTSIAASQPGPNFLVATGYGALWAQRVVTMYPNLFVRVIISSYTAPPLFDFFATFGARLTVVRQALTQCANNWQCAAQLGAGVDPHLMFDNVMSLAEANALPCNSLLQAKMAPAAGSTWRDVYLELFNGLVAPDSPAAQAVYQAGPTVSLIPAVLYRLQRCTAADVAVIETVWAAIQANTPASPAPANVQPGICYPSKILLANILFNEMVHNDPSQTVTAMRVGGVVSRSNAYVQGWLDFYTAIAPVLWRQPAANVNDQVNWYNPKGPVNMALFSGNLDPYSPNSIAAAALFWDGRQNYVTLQGVGANPLQSYVPVGQTKVYCVQNNIVTYLTSNNTIATLDGTCNGQSVPLDVFGQSTDPDYVNARNAYFGTANAGNLWAFTPPASGCFVNNAVPFTPVPPPTQPTPPPTTAKPTPPPTPVPRPTNATHDGSGDNTPIIAGAVIGSLVGLGIVLVLVWKFCRRTPKPNSFHSVNYQPPAGTSLYSRYN